MNDAGFDWLHRLGGERDIDIWYTSRGVVAEGDSYSGFNVCHYVGDDDCHVSLCRMLLCDATGIEANSLIIPRQVHSSNVLFIDHVPVCSNELEGVDALVTNMPNLAIGVSTADCLPVVLYDVETGIIGVAHAGWRGALDGIVENTLHTMIKHGADARRVKVLFGPSICVDCFEVGDEVAQRFPESCVERRAAWERPHINLHQFLTGKMLSEGVLNENIMCFDKNLCTKCHPEDFFSARVLGINSGRNFTFIRRKVTDK